VTRIERSGGLDLAALPTRIGPGPAVEIVGDGLVIECSGILRGAPEDSAPDTFHGVGIRITGHEVTLRGARVAGFKVGIHAVGTDGLVLEDCDVSGNFRQRLRSTPEQEAAEDWLEPHANDEHEWFERYGAGIYVENAERVSVKRCRARAGQNGLVLERVGHSEITDNDFSFLSGWGIALWRSSDNLIARNACDFCIRGYSHGVYNRGQDSAGILLFEQCSANVIAANSATHCGDGLFCFAGQEALGAHPPPMEGFEHAGLGCNENQISGNDFSYAAAHGLELTFSFDNTIHGNRFTGNAICGIWAGYSRRTYIHGNRFVENGDAGYGLERGGINIEHGQMNSIVANQFLRNACGVHLWWDEDPHLSTLPWTRANGHECRANTLLSNWFEGDRTAVLLRQAPDTLLVSNRYTDVETILDGEVSAPESAAAGTAMGRATTDRATTELWHPATFDGGQGESPVGARIHLGGRELIIMGEWGPNELAGEAQAR
jgi:parallel beta-helix repeat protein